MVERIREKLLELRKDERGMTVVEIVLLIALIVLPIVIVLAVFGKEIKDYIKQMWQDTDKKSKELRDGGIAGPAGG